MDVLLNDGDRFDFSNGWCSTLIYVHFMVIISMSFKIMFDECFKSFVPK